MGWNQVSRHMVPVHCGAMKQEKECLENDKSSFAGVVLSAFYGNFFVRSTDLLSLANVSPDSALGVTLSLEEPISAPAVCFQAALLYTSSKGSSVTC